jgi:hypothetical protein
MARTLDHGPELVARVARTSPERWWGPLCRGQSRICLRMQMKGGYPIAGEFVLPSRMLKDTGRNWALEF